MFTIAIRNFDAVEIVLIEKDVRIVLNTSFYRKEFVIIVLKTILNFNLVLWLKKLPLQSQRSKSLSKRKFAGVAKLVDALDLGSSVFDMGVRVPPPALLEALKWAFF